MAKLGIDIGGTFTDLVLVDRHGRIWTKKLLSTPRSPLDAIMEGARGILADANMQAANIDLVVHGSTRAANALIERNGAKSAVITTEGFRDVLEIGREWRYDMYDIFLEPPPVLVQRPLRFEIAERSYASGKADQKFDVSQLEELTRCLPLDVRAVAVCFLHSYLKPDNEREAAEVIRRIRPDLCISISSDVSRELREYERFSTAVANAYVQPIVKPYLDDLADKLKTLGIPAAPSIIVSAGTLTGIEDAAEFPIRTVESGPAAGAIAAAFFSRLSAEQDVLAFDMGGTTAKASFIESGNPVQTRNVEVARAYRFKPGSGIPLNVTSIDLIEVGAGGGSIAQVDDLGRLKVGPQSAGAEPGPACYGRDGKSATVTDADLLLGYISKSGFLGGKMRLNEEAAKKAIGVSVCQPLKIPEIEGAWGVYQVINDAMASAVKMHASEHGKDIRKSTMVAFGGAAGSHACHLADQLGIERVISPMRGSVLSAFGMLMAPVAFDFVRTVPQELDKLNWAIVSAAYADMMQNAERILAAAGLTSSKRHAIPSCDVQYRGQGHSLTIELPSGWLNDGSAKTIKARFERRYKALHGRLAANVAMEAVNWRLRVLLAAQKLAPRAIAAGSKKPPAKKEIRKAYFGALGFRKTEVFDRESLRRLHKVAGPAIVDEIDTSIVIPPGWKATVDKYASLVIEKERGRSRKGR